MPTSTDSTARPPFPVPEDAALLAWLRANLQSAAPQPEQERTALRYLLATGRWNTETLGQALGHNWRYVTLALTGHDPKTALRLLTVRAPLQPQRTRQPKPLKPEPERVVREARRIYEVLQTWRRRSGDLVQYPELLAAMALVGTEFSAVQHDLATRGTQGAAPDLFSAESPGAD